MILGLVNFTPRHLLYQLAMISFVFGTIVNSNTQKHFLLICAYTFLLLNDFFIHGKLYFDSLLWYSILFMIHAYRIIKLRYKKEDE